MIMLALLIGGAIIGAGVIATYWNNIKDWIARAAKRVSEIITGVVYGVKLFAKKLGEFYQEISKHYSQDKQGNWEETIVTRKIPESEIPQDILDMANNSETDITHKMELELA